MSAHDGEAGTLRGREEAAVKHTLPARTLCTACPARASAFFPGSWGHVGVYRARPRVTSGKSLWFSSFKDQAVEEKCLLLLSCYSRWNALKILFRRQLLIITEKAYGFPGRASVCVSETVTHWLRAPSSTSPVCMILPSSALISKTDATAAPLADSFLLAKDATKSNQTLIFGL